MADTDPLQTQRDVSTPVVTELGVAGFEDAVEIGRGGFGVVYRCTQVALDRIVAVKVLTTELDEENRARFLREQRAMGRLTGHPNIVTVLQAGTTASGRPYLVMPYHPLDSLDTRIREQGPLPVEAVLWLGVKIAGALESAHRLGIVHRDVKPGNILLTDYGEPLLTDFGIARVTGGFQTAAGTLTGSPAFTAPEVLEGEVPTAAADVYGLGATLFCALTGHAAFERRSGENVVTQFLRITTQPVPDLRDSGIAEDVSTVVASAMSRDPRERRSAAELGQAIRQVQRRLGFAVDEMALQAEPVPEHQDRTPPPRGWRPPSARVVVRGGGGALPLELTSFVDRRTEVSEVKNLLASSRLVTLTGIGGVGKTRLGLRVAATMRGLADRVWFVELADVSDPTLLVDVVAATLGLRDESARPLQDALVEFLSARESLLVLDNCEQLVAAVAELVETWLRACPGLRILVTSREPLNIAGEAVLRVSPLTVPDPDREPSMRGLPKYDAVTLFADRAAAVVPGFELSPDNKADVARICARLDGLPLAIELAAARIRMLSPEQILQRLTDRYALLTRSSRDTPTRQQTLRWCIDWSHDLCTPAEQRLWARLSVFAGSFELDAAEQICGPGLSPESPLDVLSSLVDKSILIRDESNDVVRFRLLETIRDYGRQKLHEAGEYADLRRRHRDWYQQLALDAEATWISDRQPYWIARLEREQPNLRDALEYCLSEDTEEAAEAGLRTATALFMYWTFRGLYGEGRRWIDRALAHPRAHSIPERIKAIQVGSAMAATQGDLHSATALLAQGRVLADQAPTPMSKALIAAAEGALAVFSGEFADAASCLDRAVEVLKSNREGWLHIGALTLLGMAHQLGGDQTKAIEYHQQVLSITEARGESLYRSIALCDMGITTWQQGERHRAIELLKKALRVNRQVHSPVVTALSFEALAWTADTADAERKAVLMGAAEELWRSTGSGAGILPDRLRYHDECVRMARSRLGARGFDAAFRQGRAMGVDAAVAYALEEQLTDTTLAPGPSAALTKRESQVADLIAQGLTNKQIAAKLVISPRTAQGHVEHILTKLGFTSRTQIAAWIAERAEQQS
ncbi:protein kinase [Nocardia sp. NBC_00565]|uniref:protein kinase domain-containing protein n=1 Tax=Nocardia sp. NBC_00565 TaxID=2975993 RepID=UPI002E81E3E6|nr:protein kinase [Nocardia sp. NBC_00565]WUB99862.1 protein kinase [Nocardia sp. NBC_00565]